MRSTLMLAGALALGAPSLLAAQVTWNDRPAPSGWTDEAPRVRVTIDGPRAVPLGAPMKVRFEVSDNAYVTVVRVDDNGRMTILYPYSRNQRATARGNFIHQVRNPRLAHDAAFIASDPMGGYVFALASYVPLDLSGFENRDYDRIGGWSRFTLANRSIARRPDVFIDRFAAAVLWDVDTPYDYDVDYYFPQGYQNTMSAYSLCGSLYRYGAYAYGQPLLGWEAWDIAGDSYRRNCSNYYQSVRCYSALAFYGYGGFGHCAVGSYVAAAGPAGPVTQEPQPGDTGTKPNEGVIRGGLFGPTPIPVIPAGPDPTSTLPARFDQVRTADGMDLDNIMSIPARATKKMKEDDARNERSGGAAGASRNSFDRADATDGKVEKARTADAGDAPARVQPPSREPTKSKGASEPRRETTSKTGYGSTGRTSNTRPSNGPDRVSRPTVDTKTTAGGTVASPNPPSIQGTTTEKKKPPMN